MEQKLALAFGISKMGTLNLHTTHGLVQETTLRREHTDSLC